jgi:DnaK suppressor protein
MLTMTDFTSMHKTLLAQREQILVDLEAIATLNKETGDWEALPVSEVSEADANNEADGVEDWNERHATVTQLEVIYRDCTRALEKLTAGTFGVCEVCGEPIAEQRLLILPTARTCVLHIDDERTLTL